MKISGLKLFFGFVIVALILWFGINFAPGSYVNTPKYEFNISEKQLIEKISLFKDSEPTYKVPIEYDLIEGMHSDKWFHIYIYYKNENQILNCWVRGYGPERCTFAIVSIKDYTGKWKSLNKDFTKQEIEKLKETFERRIINKLRK